MEKKNVSGLVVLVIILILIIIGFSGYIVFDKFLKENTISNNNKINISINQKNGTNKYNELEINSKSIDKKDMNLKNVFFLDESYIVVEYENVFADELMSKYYVFDKEGNQKYDINELSSVTNGKAEEVSFDTNANVLYIHSFVDYVGEEYSDLCSEEYNDDDIYEVWEQVKYLGNGLFDKGTIIDSLTVKEYLEEHPFSCEGYDPQY